MEIKVRKAFFQDRESIGRLLCKLDNDVDWSRLFRSYWNLNSDWIGYVAEVGDRPVGFLGLIFSQRIIGGVEQKFCNTTSWIVEEEFSGAGLALIGALLKLRGYQIVVLSASEVVFEILSTLGFKRFETALRVIPWLPSKASRVGGGFFEVIRGADRLIDDLSAEDRSICLDHIETTCEHFLLSDGESKCYIVGSRIFKYRIPLLRIHYISNTEFFASRLRLCRDKLCVSSSAIALLVDERFFNGAKVDYSARWNLPWQRLSRGGVIDPVALDNLYSEYPILGI